ncbi:MAG: hypothetical protein MUP85_11105 [Candidatus Lokiarchaeota archaeon]|nr:hypothetical protein [Candidatus Lokiarchaeota archaeon]
MDYQDKFKEVLFHLIKEERTKNQLLGDLHLLSEQINEELKTLNAGYEKLFSDQSQDFTKYNKLIRATEYNNALIFSMLRPPNLIELLNKAIIEERYYFFFTVADILLTSDLNLKIKNQLKVLVSVFRHKLNLPQLDVNYTELKTLQSITQQLLDAALGNFEDWQKSTKKIIGDLVGQDNLTLSELKRKIRFDDILNLKNQLELKF